MGCLDCRALGRALGCLAVALLLAFDVETYTPFDAGYGLKVVPTTLFSPMRIVWPQVYLHRCDHLAFDFRSHLAVVSRLIPYFVVECLFHRFAEFLQLFLHAHLQCSSARLTSSYSLGVVFGSLQHHRFSNGGVLRCRSLPDFATLMIDLILELTVGLDQPINFALLLELLCVLVLCLLVQVLLGLLVSEFNLSQWDVQRFRCNGHGWVIPAVHILFQMPNAIGIDVLELVRPDLRRFTQQGQSSCRHPLR